MSAKRVAHLFLLLIGIFLPIQVACAESVGVSTVNSIINPHELDATDYTSDMAGVISQEDEDSINAICYRLDKEADLEMLIVTVNTIGGADPFDFSLALYEHIGIGRNDRGMLIFVAVDDHKWEIRTGYGAEGDFPDAICSYIGRNEMVPRFRNNDYGGGILDAVNYIGELALDPEALQALKAQQEREADSDYMDDDDMSALWFLIIVWAGIALIAYFVNRPSSTDRLLKSLEKREFPKEMTINADKGDIIRAEWNRDYKISYWEYAKFWRTMLYFVIPSVATGVACQITRDYETLAMAIFACNTWAALVYYMSRLVYRHKYAKLDYEKRMSYAKGEYGVKKYLLLLLAPWVTIPAMLLALPGYIRVKRSASSCPHCGGNMKRIVYDEDINSLLSKAERKEREIGSRIYSLFECENGHKVIVSGKGNSKYIKCDHCGAKTAYLKYSKVIKSPSYVSTGTQLDTYVCEFCGKEYSKSKTLAKLTMSSGGGSSSSGGHGGGFSGGHSGGSFGGGHSGGGGSGGGW